MKNKRTQKILIAFLLICICLFSLKTYSDYLIKDGSKILWGSKNPSAAIKKFRAAQTVWLPLHFDKHYQELLTELNQLESRPAINIFIKDGIKTDELDSFIRELQGIAGVSMVKFISHEDAYKIHKEQFRNDPYLLQFTQPNLLPQLVEVSLSDFSVRDAVEKVARSKSFVTEVIQII